MSTLWTPGGEIPVDRNPSPLDADRPDPTGPGPAEGAEAGAGGAGGGAGAEVDLDDLSPEEREQAEQMIREMAEARARLLSAPAAAVVANHGMGLYELAALHLTQQPPNFSEAVVAIDALGAVTGSLAGRLGEAEATLNDALDQIRKAYVQLKNQADSNGKPQADSEDGDGDGESQAEEPAEPDSD